jgi:hypothetical protein
MKRNHRAITRVPLAEYLYSEGYEIRALGARTGLTVDVRGDKLRTRIRDKVRLSNRAIPRDDDKPPRDSGVKVRHDLIERGSKLKRAKRSKPRVIGGVRIGGKRRVRNALKAFFPEWSGDVVPAAVSPARVDERVKRLKYGNPRKHRAPLLQGAIALANVPRFSNADKAKQHRGAIRSWITQDDIRDASRVVWRVPLKDFRTMVWRG